MLKYIILLCLLATGFACADSMHTKAFFAFARVPTAPSPLPHELDATHPLPTVWDASLKYVWNLNENTTDSKSTNITSWTGSAVYTNGIAGTKGAKITSTSYLGSTTVDPDSYNLGLSYCGWVLWDGTANAILMGWRYDGSWGGVYLFMASTNIGYRFGNGNSTGNHWDVAGGGNGIVANTLYHVAATHSGTVDRLYINGVQVNQSTGGTLSGTSTSFQIGRGTDGTERPSGGMMDDVAVWTRLLSSNEIFNIYSSARP